LHLADPEKSISRKHLSLQFEHGSPPAVVVTVLSTVNSVASNKGEMAPGQKSLCHAGDTLQIGPYTMSIASAPYSPIVTATPSASDDPLAALGLRGAPHAESPDPLAQVFVKPHQTASPYDHDPLAALGAPGFGVAQPASSFSGTSPVRDAPVSAGRPNDPMAMFGASSGGNSSLGSIDNWLGAEPASGLGASRMLADFNQLASPTMARDHVHDFHLPAQLPAAPPANHLREASAPAQGRVDPPPAGQAAASGEISDTWASLQEGWADARPAPPGSAPVSDALGGGTPGSATATPPAPGAWGDFGASWVDQIPEAAPEEGKAR
jgi:predicted component of type VI protein secretion system